MNNIITDDYLARFILESNRFKKSENLVKYNTFLPNAAGKTSVFRIKDLTSNDIWTLGESEVASKVSKTLYGRADILSSVIITNKLTIDQDDKPPRHANITSWPTEKSEQKLIALELASQAHLYLR